MQVLVHAASVNNNAAFLYCIIFSVILKKLCLTCVRLAISKVNDLLNTCANVFINFQETLKFVL